MNTTVIENIPVPDVVVPELTAFDACDATASGTETATVRVASADGAKILDLCAHHYQKYATSLLAQGFFEWQNHTAALRASYR